VVLSRNDVTDGGTGGPPAGAALVHEGRAKTMDRNAGFDGDDALFAQLGEALAGLEPVPEAMLEAARAAFAWREIDGELELLSLTEDSFLRDGALMRSTAAVSPRTLVFEGDDLSLDLEVDSEIVGQVMPPQPCRVVLMNGGAALAEVDTDALGCFRVTRPDRGPIRVTCRTADRVVATEWWQL
jgi:hypothetical protein